MTDTNLILEVVEQSGIKLNFLLEKMGMTHPTWKSRIENKTYFDSKEMTAFCNATHSWEKLEQIFFAKKVDK